MRRKFGLPFGVSLAHVYLFPNRALYVGNLAGREGESKKNKAVALLLCSTAIEKVFIPSKCPSFMIPTWLGGVETLRGTELRMSSGGESSLHSNTPVFQRELSPYTPLPGVNTRQRRRARETTQTEREHRQREKIKEREKETGEKTKHIDFRIGFRSQLCIINRQRARASAATQSGERRAVF